MHAYIKSENGRLTGISKDDIISINFILHIYFRIIVLPPDIWMFIVLHSLKINQAKLISREDQMFEWSWKFEHVWDIIKIFACYIVYDDDILLIC